MLYINHLNIPRTYGILQPFHIILRCYKTHYQVLNLPVDCTTHDIRQAFINLSKEHHPDVNPSKQSHAKFLRINEAYKVLGKADSRKSYDLGLAIKNAPSQGNHARSKEHTKDPYADDSFWTNRDKSRDAGFKNEPYYGVAGIKRMSNSSIAMICVGLAMIGVGLQIAAICKSFTLRREKMLKDAIQTETEYIEFRKAALRHGNHAQLEALKLRFSEANHPSNK